MECKNCYGAVVKMIEPKDTEIARLTQQLAAATERVEQQAEQIAELKRDAERYRALRDMPGNGDELDADIDTLILDATKGEA